MSDKPDERDERLKKNIREVLTEMGITKPELESMVKKYQVPKSYTTCSTCGTIYPEDCYCPKCRPLETKEEKTDEDKKEDEDEELW